MKIGAALLIVAALIQRAPEHRASDDAAVLKAALEDLCPGNYLVIDSANAQPIDVEPGRLRRFPAAALENLRSRNRHPVTLPLEDICPGARIASHAEIAKAFDVPPPSLSEPADLEWRWAGFFLAFPGAASLVRMSLPGYSARGNSAVVYMTTGRSSLAGEGSYLLLKRRGGRWRLVRRDSVWVA
jgi:hypothetical protein